MFAFIISFHLPKCLGPIRTEITTHITDGERLVALALWGGPRAWAQGSSPDTKGREHSDSPRNI